MVEWQFSKLQVASSSLAYRSNLFMIMVILLKENKVNSDYFEVYHGGRRWYGPPEINPPKQGRYEHGIGLYFTTNLETARKYGKRYVTKAKIKNNFVDLKDVKLPIDEIIYFLKTNFSNSKSIQQDVFNYSKRTNRNTISLDILNNIIVNAKFGNKRTYKIIVEFFVKNGVDASVIEQSGEQWLVVFNPSIIIDYDLVDYKSNPQWNLPNIR